MSPGSLAIALIAGVALLGWLLRRGTPIPPAAFPAAATAVVPEESEADERDLELAITSEGDVFIPDGRAVRIVSMGDAEEIEDRRDDIESGLVALDAGERRHLRSLLGKPGYALQPGDLTAARIRRGAAGVVPWRLETLGRDGDYGLFSFETEDGARAALRLIETCDIVRRPLDEDGRAIPASSEDFEEARRRYEDSLRAAALEMDPGDEPGPPYSTRR